MFSIVFLFPRFNFSSSLILLLHIGFFSSQHHHTSYLSSPSSSFSTRNSQPCTTSLVKSYFHLHAASHSPQLFSAPQTQSFSCTPLSQPSPIRTCNNFQPPRRLSPPIKSSLPNPPSFHNHLHSVSSPFPPQSHHPKPPPHLSFSIPQPNSGRFFYSPSPAIAATSHWVALSGETSPGFDRLSFELLSLDQVCCIAES